MKEKELSQRSDLEVEGRKKRNRGRKVGLQWVPTTGPSSKKIDGIPRNIDSKESMGQSQE